MMYVDWKVVIKEWVSFDFSNVWCCWYLNNLLNLCKR